MSLLKPLWKPRTVLKTARLVLRPPHKRDAAMLAHHLSDSRVSTMLTHVALPYADERAANWIAGMQAEIRRGEARYFVLERGSAVVGLAGLDGIDGKSAELGYWLGHPWWGKGLMSEAVRPILRMAWQHPALERITAVHMVDNPASGRLLLKAGFKYTGTVKLHSRARGMDVMCRTMAKERPKRALRSEAKPGVRGLHPFRQPSI